MIHLACKPPIALNIAVSGGPDSMALLDFCRNGKRKVNVIHIDHGTKFGKEAREFVVAYCAANNIPCQVHVFNDYGMPANEEVWRNYRLEVFRKYTSKDEIVATGHHLGDLFEWYMMTTLHGSPKFMQPIDEEHKLIKPFLYTEKSELIDWCKRKNVPYLIDPTNEGEYNSRGILRGMMGQFAKIHPGFMTSIMNKAKAVSNV